MRKPFTLSLDEEFVARLDEQRGLVPRSRFIETLGVTVGLDGTREARAVVRERSPEPQVDSGVSRGSSPAVRPTDETVAAATGHKVGCRCLGCERVRGNVS